MRVALISPWDNAWVPLYRAAIERRGHNFSLHRTHIGVYSDLILHGWANTHPVAGTRNVMFLRRYELFTGDLHKIDWSRIERLICVNTWIQARIEETFRANGIPVPVHCIYNAFDPARWTFRERAPGTRIGMACHVHPKKNLPLALQILASLPDIYTLHIAGEVQDPCTAEYLNHLAKRMRRKIYFYNHVPADLLNFWWEQMHYCLSTSISEGNPNNVIEAMAKGIKPVVHAWPGAEDQFPDHLFHTAAEAAAMIKSFAYDSHAYRALAESRFSTANIECVLDLVGL